MGSTRGAAGASKQPSNTKEQPARARRNPTAKHEVVQIHSSDDSEEVEEASSSGQEEAEAPRQRPRQRGVAAAAGTTKQARSRSRARPATASQHQAPQHRPTGRATRASATAAAAQRSDDGSDTSDTTSEDSEEEEQPRASRGNRRAAAHATKPQQRRAAAHAGNAPRQGGPQAAASSDEGSDDEPSAGASKPAATAKAGTAGHGRQGSKAPARSAQAAHRRPAPGTAAAAAVEDSDGPSQSGSGDDDDDDHDDEHIGDAAGPSAPAGRRARGSRGRPGALPGLEGECRKRLFELLERRIGDGSRPLAGGYAALPDKNAAKKARLMASLRDNFDDWHARLRSRFSLLLFGFGSKRSLLDAFAAELAGARNRGDAAVLVFQGWSGRCSARDVVVAVAGALMQRSFRTGVDARGLVADIAAEPTDRHVFAVVHSIDGPGLRGSLPLLSHLAACPQVHLIASCDHAMAPLLWSAQDAARFRWQMINASTYEPYIKETQDRPSVLQGIFRSGAVTASAGSVLRSLVLGAQEVFKVLAEHLLEDEECEGVAFAHLYRMCRERFLVRDERVLRQHLVEFTDHQLLRVRPPSDEQGELLTIPLSHAELRAVLQDLVAARGGAAD